MFCPTVNESKRQLETNMKLVFQFSHHYSLEPLLIMAILGSYRASLVSVLKLILLEVSSEWQVRWPVKQFWIKNYSIMRLTSIAV
jgi:hypothetical protein